MKNIQQLRTWSYEAAYYLKNYRAYMRRQYMSPDAIHALQCKKLTYVLSEATKHVPFYRPYKHLFDFQNITLDDLKKLPIVTKQQMREEPELFTHQYARQDEPWQSSGSTGEPFRFRVPRMLRFIDRMIFLRTMSNDSFRMTARSPLVMLSSYCPSDGEPLYKKFGPFNNIWRLSPFHLNEKTLNQYIEMIVKSKTSVLSGYPSSIYLLTLHLMNRGLHIPSIKVIKTASEMLLPEQRALITSWWKLPVLDWYGQAEMTALVIQCPHGRYHNQDDYGLCEINDNKELILTSLNNTVMPFLRYNSGDLAEPAHDTTPCPCGRTFTVPFTQVLGRKDDLLSKCDGTKVPVVNFYTMMSKIPNIKQYKIVQHADYSIELFLVTKPGFDAESTIIRGMRERLGDVGVKLSYQDSIARHHKTMKQKIVESYVL